MIPVKRLKSRLIPSRLVQFFKPAFTSPRSELLDRSRYRKRDKEPIDQGISPWNLFRLRSRIFKNVRFAIDGVILPERPSEVRLSTVTLRLCFRLQVIPGHEQKAVVVFHAASARRWSLTLALKASKASPSDLSLSGVDDAGWSA
ncbi:hypothetical protein ZWY2020_057287 [Hordeum vulgare]|nr:hypothetical protein ZWY2020_057287 [Hordeum vulgare]